MSQEKENPEFLEAKRNPDENINTVILMDDKEKRPIKTFNNNNEKEFERNYERNYDFRYPYNYKRQSHFRYGSRREKMKMFKKNQYKETIEERAFRHYILDYVFSRNNIEIFKETSIKKGNLDNIFLVTEKKQEDFYKDLEDFQSLVIR